MASRGDRGWWPRPPRRRPTRRSGREGGEGGANKGAAGRRRDHGHRGGGRGGGGGGSGGDGHGGVSGGWWRSARRWTRPSGHAGQEKGHCSSGRRAYTTPLLRHSGGARVYGDTCRGARRQCRTGRRCAACSAGEVRWGSPRDASARPRRASAVAADACALRRGPLLAPQRGDHDGPDVRSAAGQPRCVELVRWIVGMPPAPTHLQGFGQAMRGVSPPCSWKKSEIWINSSMRRAWLHDGRGLHALDNSLWHPQRQFFRCDHRLGQRSGDWRDALGQSGIVDDVVMGVELCSSRAKRMLSSLSDVAATTVPWRGRGRRDIA